MSALDTELYVRGWRPPEDLPGVWTRQNGVVRVPLNAADLIPDHASISVRGPLASAAEGIDPEEVAVRLVDSELRDVKLWREYAIWFQRETVCRLLAREGGLVWLPPGTGKTFISVLFALASPGVVVVVTRASARETYRRELQKYSTITPYVHMPQSEWRIKKHGPYRTPREYLDDQQQAGRRPWWILGWEALSDTREHAELAHLWSNPFATVIFDESHFGKNFNRERYRKTYDEAGKEHWNKRKVDHRSTHAAALAEMARRRVAMTATPVANRLEDLWGQLTLVEVSGWGTTATKFRRRYCGAFENSEGFLTTAGADPTNVDELQARLAWSVIKFSDHETRAGLPPFRRMVSYVPASEQRAPLLEDAPEGKRREGIAAWLKRLTKEAATPGAGQRRARAQLLEAHRMVAASKKQPAIVDLIKEYREVGKGKVIVFTGRRVDCAALYEAVQKIGIEAWWADGSVSQDVREDLQKAYMEHPGPCALVATWATLGESLNLQDTDLIIWAMLPATPREVDQGEGRGRRLGQSRPLAIHYLIAEGTVDEHFADTLINKLPAVELVQGDSSTIHDLRDSLENAGDTEAWVAEALAALEMEV